MTGEPTIGIIAGGGQFPIMVAEAAKARGLRTVAVAHYGETEPGLSEKVNKIFWIKLGQLGHLIKAFRTEGVKKAIMAGSIAKKRMFENLRPDLKGLAIMTKLAVFHDDDILRAVANELAGEGIEIVSSTAYLPELLAEEGCFTKRKPGREEMEDILFGWKVAKELGRMDIGQSVVVRQKTVLAVEAIDGTDATIRRGGKIAKERAIVVKVCKPNQDLRFDVPSVGLETIEIMGEVKAAVLALEAGRTLIFDREKMLEKANEKKIVIIALGPESVKTEMEREP